jgi:glycosyltransferase involved in cell wall biosynthesis
MMFLFPHRDRKSTRWGDLLRDTFGIGVVELHWHPFFHWIEIILLSIRNRSRPVYIFRYLGDYPDIFRTLLRLAADSLTILVCYLAGGHVRWIVHNVDRETFMHHPKLLRARRLIIGLSARKIYVTDECLLPIAREHLNVDAKKLGVVTFGVDKVPGNDDFSRVVVERIKQIKMSAEPPPLIGLCATAVAQKCWHLFQMEHVLESLNVNRIELVMVLICDVRRASDPEIRSVIERLEQRPDVITLPQGGMVSELHLKGYVDFIYRSLTDQSIPYTLYNAAEAEIPVLTHDIGLTAPLVRSTGIGVIWEELASKTRPALEQALAGCSEHHYRKFLAERNWDRGAAALAEGIAPHSAMQELPGSPSVVHICNNYTSSKVHALIAENMAGFFKRQTFIIPVRTKQELQVAEQSTDGITLMPVFFRNSVIRFFPLSKAFYVFLICFRRISGSFEAGKAKLIIAHNFWSDGVVAFVYCLFSSASYTLVVRNTDINIFIPKLPHYQWLMKFMIARANALVFVSEAHRKLFAERFPRLYARAQRVEVIPNGISDFWLDSETDNCPRLEKVCYVGRFNKNKNLVRLVDACEQLLNEFPSLELVMAGGDNSELERILGKPVPAFVRTLGLIEDDRILRDVYRSSRVFAMPSLTETFGLVYLEALSQGCAVVCTEFQGIDGMFDLPYVRSVDPLSVDQIREAVGDLLAYENGVWGQEMNEHLQNFSWRRIGQVYSEVVL